MTAYLQGIAWAFGTACSIHDPAARCEIEGPVDDLARMGFATFMRSDLSIAVLGLRSLRRSLDAAGLEPGDIDALIVCTSTHPGSVSSLQSELEELLRQAGFRRLNLFLVSFARCSNVPSALILARTMLADGEARRIAIVTVDRHDRQRGPRNSQNNTQIMSDAAASCVVGAEIGPYRLDAIRRVADLSIATTNLVGTVAERLAAYDDYHRLIRDLARDVDGASLDGLITHNMAVPSIRAMAREFGVAVDKLFVANVPRIGHAFSADGLVNLEDWRASAGDSDRVQSVALLLTGINTHAVVRLSLAATTGKDRFDAPGSPDAPTLSPAERPMDAGRSF